MSNKRINQRIEFADCPCSGRNLERFIQPAILAAIATESLHGYSILSRLAKMGLFKDSKPDATGLYRFLKAMEDRGLVTSAWDMPQRGPAKRVFTLTAAGVSCLSKWIATLDAYRSQISKLLDVLRKSQVRRGIGKGKRK